MNEHASMKFENTYPGDEAITTRNFSEEMNLRYWLSSYSRMATKRGHTWAHLVNETIAFSLNVWMEAH